MRMYGRKVLLLLFAALVIASDASVIPPSGTGRSCMRNGYTYSIVPDTACSAFSQVTAADLSTTLVHKCPLDFIFDLESCACALPEEGSNCIEVTDYAGCGGSLFGEGHFSSPNYPELYPNRQSCTWTLTAPPGKSLLLLFKDFELESGVGCGYDYVKIYNGVVAQKNLIRTACGAKIPDEVIGEGLVTVVFSSNDVTQMKGFSAAFHSVDGPVRARLNGQGSCDANYQGTIGTVASPNYPNLYPNRANCIYTITVPNQVVLTFASMNIEYHYACDRDYLEVRDGNSTAKVLAKICGTTLPAKIMSSGPVLYLKFVSDYSATSTGFYALWQGFPKDGISTTTEKSTNGLFTEAKTTTSEKLPEVTTAASVAPSQAHTQVSTEAPAVQTANAQKTEQTKPTPTTPTPATPTPTTPTPTTPTPTTPTPTTPTPTTLTPTTPTPTTPTPTTPTPTTPTPTTPTPTTPAPTTPTTTSPQTVAATRVPAKSMCFVNGNAYRPIKDSGCTQFTLHAPDGFWVLNCPKGLAFDPNVCFCRKAGDFVCAAGSDQAQLNTNVPKTTERTTPAPTATTTTSLPTTIERTTPKPTQTTTTSSPTVAATRVQPKSTCTVNGNIYRPIKDRGCTQFTLHAPDGFWVLDCPKGLAFDLNVCFCRKPSDFICSSGGQDLIQTTVPKVTLETATTHSSTTEPTPTMAATTSAAATRSPPKDTCNNFGRIYGLVKDTGCTKFVRLAPEGDQILNCPTGFAFDLSTCACRYSDDFACSSGGFDPALLRTPVPKTTLETATTSSTSTEPTPTTAATTSAAATILPPKYTCDKVGRIYGLVKDTGCTKFVRLAPEGDQILDCPTGFAFDLSSCSCRYHDDFPCSSGGFDPALLRTTVPKVTQETATTHSSTTEPTPTTAATTSAAATRSPSKETCDNFGRIYGLVKDTGCTKFVRLAPEGDQILDCPTGFAFDLSTCACRYSDDFACSSGGFDPALLRTAAPTTTVETRPKTAAQTTTETATKMETTTKSSRSTEFATGATKLDVNVTKATPLVDTSGAAATKSTTVATETTKFVQTPIAVQTSIVLTTTAPDSCTASGNVHRLVENMKCLLYRLETPDRNERIHQCPKDLYFDLGACACRPKQEFVCAD